MNWEGLIQNSDTAVGEATFEQRAEKSMAAIGAILGGRMLG